MKTPDELLKELEGDKLPDDLKWIMARFKMESTDPVFLLLAWHWRRLNESQDVLRQENLAFKAVYENGAKNLQEHLEKWQEVGYAIAQFQTNLAKLTKDTEKEFQDTMHKPLAAALAANQQLTNQLNGTIQKLEAQSQQNKWHLPIACLLAGFAFGAGLIPWTFSLLVAR